MIYSKVAFMPISAYGIAKCDVGPVLTMSGDFVCVGHEEGCRSGLGWSLLSGSIWVCAVLLGIGLDPAAPGEA